MNTVRTFFPANSKYPSFEMENGEIKTPKFNNFGRVRWFTETEFAEYKKTHAKEFAKRDNPSKFQKFMNRIGL